MTVDHLRRTPTVPCRVLCVLSEVLFLNLPRFMVITATTLDTIYNYWCYDRYFYTERVGILFMNKKHTTLTDGWVTGRAPSPLVDTPM